VLLSAVKATVRMGGTAVSACSFVTSGAAAASWRVDFKLAVMLLLLLLLLLLMPAAGPAKATGAASVPAGGAANDPIAGCASARAGRSKVLQHARWST